MKAQENLFGKAIGVDPRLWESSSTLESLTLREQTPAAAYFFSKGNRLVSFCLEACGRGPDRVLVERIPDFSKGFDREGWTIKEGKFHFKKQVIMNLKDVPPQRSDVLPVINDFPGHTRSILTRETRSLDSDIRSRLNTLVDSLKNKTPEALEGPLVGVIGYGKNPVPCGDAALCGMLLTARAFALGKRFQLNWHLGLSLEIRRLLHRTSSFSAIHLGYAFEGRTTDLQERFFVALEKDYETLSETLTGEILQSADFSGPYFLLGVLMVLDILRAEAT